MVVVYEGLHTYGGMAGRDMEALAIGIEECMQDQHVRSRIGQVRYLGDTSRTVGYPDCQAGRWARHFPGCERLLRRTCPRAPSRARRSPPNCTSTPACARWSAASSAPVATPKPAITAIPKLELTRLTIPRRVYTQSHMDVVAESVKAVYDRRHDTHGLRMVYEPEYLRFFQARFEPIS